MPDDGDRHELIRGELRTVTPAGHPHGRIAMRFAWPLAQYVEERRLGAVYAAETGFLLASDPDTVRAPDVAFVRRERVAEVGETGGYLPGAPDLAVEVISPGDTYTGVEGKVTEWLQAGARMVIVVDPPNRAVKVHCGPTVSRRYPETTRSPARMWSRGGACHCDGCSPEAGNKAAVVDARYCGTGAM